MKHCISTSPIVLTNFWHTASGRKDGSEVEVQ